MPSVDEVRDFWQRNPLLSHELTEIGSVGYFEELDEIKRTDVEKFALGYWDFEGFAGKKVLDVGCGPGWLTVNYAAGGGDVQSFDLTPRAVKLTKRHLKIKGLSADVNEGNSEKIDFPDATFNLVVASGVLHHTPDYEKAIAECLRVLKPGGQAKITLYRKGIMHNKLGWFFASGIMRIFRVNPCGAGAANTAKDVDEFIRQYNGSDNPSCIAHRDKDWAEIIAGQGFRIDGRYVHFFPKRLLPFRDWVPTIVHRFLDAYLGTMIYFQLSKEPRDEVAAAPGGV